MKLLFCRACGDVFNLSHAGPRTCSCKATGGRWRNALEAEFYGSYAMPLEFADGSFSNALDTGKGEFWAFVSDGAWFYRVDKS